MLFSFETVTESEIREGIFRQSKPEAVKRTFVIIKGLETSTREPLYKKRRQRHVCVKSPVKATESYDAYMLSELKNKVGKHLPKSNVLHLKVSIFLKYFIAFFSNNLLKVDRITYKYFHLKKS